MAWRPDRQPTIALIAASTAIAFGASAPLPAYAKTYGKLLVRHQAAPSAALDTTFAGAAPRGSFVLVVTEPTQTTVEVHWALRCVGRAHHERGGASGRALISSGHWVKRVRASWIKRPASCTGSVSGAAAASPVLVRVFAD